MNNQEKAEAAAKEILTLLFADFAKAHGQVFTPREQDVQELAKIILRHQFTS